jgi:hypothetical protein
MPSMCGQTRTQAALIASDSAMRMRDARIGMGTESTLATMRRY